MTPTIHITIYVAGPVGAGKSRAITTMIEALNAEFIIDAQQIRERHLMEDVELTLHLKER